jgi:hypothetical protein
MPREEYVGRYASVYFASPEDMQHWEKIAKDRGMRLSSLMMAGLECLQKNIDSAPGPNLIKENEMLKAEIAGLKRELRLLTELIEKYESELYKARHAAFQDITPQAEGSRSFDLELIQILKSSRNPMDSGALLAALRIDPGDMEAVRLVRNQLAALDRYNLVTDTSHGWRWKK